MNNKVKIKLSIDTDNAKHVSALNIFLEALNTSEVASITEAPKKAPVRPTSKAKVVEDIKVEAPENVSETIADEAKQLANRPAMEVKEEPAKAITREEVRALMAPKVATHRDAIANQLRNVMGFQSVTLLPEDKLQEFADYLNALN
jgi:hypothetical protein